MDGTPDLQSVLVQLNRLQKPSLGDTLAMLQDLGSASRIASIVQAFAPERFEALRSAAQIRKSPNRNTPLEDALLETLQEHFPIGWGMDELFINLEAGEAPYITIEPQGYWMTEEDFYDTLDFEQGTISKNASAAYFAKFLDSGLSDTEAWDRATAYFGWPRLYPNHVLNDREIKKFDVEKFEELLEAHGLDDLLLVFRIVWHASGNYFLDYYEDFGEETIEMTIENVERLKAEWDDAKRMLESIDKLAEQIEENPAILALTLGYWDACIEYEKTKPKTLVDVWGNLRPEAELVDPFYGPLTGDIAEYEEEEA